MHPSETKIQTQAATTKAKRDGFTATANAPLLLAEACVDEAGDLESSTLIVECKGRTSACQGGIFSFEIDH